MYYELGASRKTARAILVTQFSLIIILGSLICQNSYNIECMYIVDLEIADKYLSILQKCRGNDKSVDKNNGRAEKVADLGYFEAIHSQFFSSHLHYNPPGRRI